MEETALLSMSFPPANRTIWVRQVYLDVETFLLMWWKDLPKHALCYQQTPLRKLSDKATQTTVSLSWLFLSGLPFITLSSFYEGWPIFGLSFDIMYTFLLPDAPLWYAVCVPPLLCDSMGCFLPLQPPPSIHTQTYRPCQPQSLFNWWRLLAAGGEKTPHDSGSGPSQKTTFSVQGGKQTMLCRPYRGSLPLLLKALTPSCLSTSTKLWTIVTCMPALVTSLPRMAPNDDQWSSPAGVADGLWHPTGLTSGPTHLVTDRLSLYVLSTPMGWKR